MISSSIFLSPKSPVTLDKAPVEIFFLINESVLGQRLEHCTTVDGFYRAMITLKIFNILAYMYDAVLTLEGV